MRLISLGRLLGIGCAALLAAAACTSGGETDGTGDGDGDGDGDATGGMSGDGDGAGGTAGDGDGDNPTDATDCLPAIETVLLDFTFDTGMGGAAPSEVDGEFGDYSTTFSGGTYTYPLGDGDLVSDVTGDNWHISGNVNEYAGFGLYFGGGCARVDASMFSGIRLTISGDTGGSPVTLSVGSTANQIASTWREDQGQTDVVPNFGECMPITNEYDGSCVTPTYVIAAGDVSETPTTVDIMWADLMGGEPSDVDPSEITAIAWYFEWSETHTAADAYDIDVVIDDIEFIE